MKSPFVSLCVAGLLALPAQATSFYVSPDVPTNDPSAGTPVYLPWEIVRDDSGAYGSALMLPAGTAVDAIHRRNVGDWLFSVEAAVELPAGGGTVFEPGDVIRYDGATYTSFLDASAAGIPPGADVDAAFLLGGDAGDLVVSFDIPTTIGATTYEPADLVRFTGAAFSVYFDASATTPAIPASSNVTGADLLADGRILLTFDVPTTLGGTTFLPGQFVAWGVTSGFLSYRLDTGWPLSSRADGCGMLATPGRLQPTLQVDKAAAPGNLVLSWGPSCSVGGEYYGIYEGDLATLHTQYSHTSLECARSGLTEEVMPSGGNRYYIVVPHNPNVEGSYGRDSDGTERPRGSPSACNGTQELEACP